jgi:hypothetical protein
MNLATGCNTAALRCPTPERRDSIRLEVVWMLALITGTMGFVISLMYKSEE